VRDDAVLSFGELPNCACRRPVPHGAGVRTRPPRATASLFNPGRIKK
jgi:hypothetical protein